MALIKCTECGHEVSDKASTCPNCGSPIEKKVLCKECGQEIPEHTEVCPNCGCPNIQEKDTPKSHSHSKSTSSDERTKKIQRFLVENRKNLPQNRFGEIQEMLENLNEENWNKVEYIVFKDPTMMLVISVLVGEFGVDRFMLGDTSNGAIKLLLTLCCGVGLIWWIIDIFQINNMTLDYNYKLLKSTLEYI